MNPIFEGSQSFQEPLSERVQNGISTIRKLHEETKSLSSDQIENFSQKISTFTDITPELFRLMEKPETFFPILEICVQTAETYDQLRAHDEYYFYNRDTNCMRRESLFMLSCAINFLENESTHKFSYTQDQSLLVTKAIEVCIHSSDAASIDSAVNFYNKHKDELTAISNTLKTTEDILSSIESYIKSEGFIINAARALDRDFRSMDGKNIRYCNHVIDEFLLSKGLNADKLEASWLARNQKEGYLSIGDNVEQIIQLEKVKPGITAFLYKEYGIRNFYRYPREILIDQFENHNKNDLPYGVFIVASRDWNGVFSQSELERFDGEAVKPSMLEDFYQQIKGRYYFRVFECDGKFTLLKNFYDLHKSYGNNHKIDFALVMGHGDYNSIELNNESGNDMGYLYRRDLQGNAVKKVSDWFSDDACILLNSCGTGKDGGIAETLSQGLKRKIIAPTIGTKILKINVSWTETMRPNFDVVYRPDYDKPGEDIKREYVSSLEN